MTVDRTVLTSQSVLQPRHGWRRTLVLGFIHRPARGAPCCCPFQPLPTVYILHINMRRCMFETACVMIKDGNVYVEAKEE